MRKPRVIVFDDDPQILDLLGGIFSSMQFEVVTYAEPLLCSPCEQGGDCAMPCADLVITDFKMPVRNGIELLSCQKRRGCAIDLMNKAVTSGDMSPENLVSSRSVAGIFFQKPFSLTTIRAWTEECLSRVDLSRPLRGYKECPASSHA